MRNRIAWPVCFCIRAAEHPKRLRRIGSDFTNGMSYLNVGFDDVVLARYLYPALTTMHYPVEQMARCAAQLAIQLYQGITPPPSSNHFNAELVIRDSVAPYFSR